MSVDQKVQANPINAFEIAVEAGKDAEKTPVVWHFTRPEALYDILKPGGGLRATHTAFLNDRRETYLVQDTLSLLNDQIEAFATRGLEHKDVVLGLVKNGALLSSFVTCFCKTIASPLMWRVYTRSGGFAIGFRKNELLDNVECPQGFVFRSGNCHYDIFPEPLVARRKNRLRSEIQKFVEKHPKGSRAFEILRKHHSKRIKDRILGLSQDVSFIKHPFFKDEKEFRLVFTRNGLLAHSDFQMIDNSPRIDIHFKAPLHQFVSLIKVSPLGNAEENLKTARFIASVLRIGADKVSMFECPIKK